MPKLSNGQFFNYNIKSVKFFCMNMKTKQSMPNTFQASDTSALLTKPDDFREHISELTD